MNRQKWILTILLACLGGAIGYALWYDPLPQSPQPFAKPSKDRATPGPAVTAASQGLLRDLLTPGQDSFPGFKKDIFSLQPAGGKSRDRQQKPEELTPASTVLVPAVPAPAAPAPPDEAELARRELAKFNFIGYLDKAGERTVFLGIGEEIFFVRKGSTFGRMNEFSVQDLNRDLLIIKRTGEVMPMTIPLVEKSPLLLKSE